jgi:DNA modification methylase
MKEEVIMGDCLIEMQKIEENSIDLTVTSPPYDNLRTYNGYTFDFEGIAKELYRITKQGGVVVWVVGDATIKGSETGTSFKQALYFKEIGFNLHDTMIYHKPNAMPLTHNRYDPCFEYMFVFSKGIPKTFNPIKEKTLHEGKINKRELEVKMIGIKGHQSRNRDEHTVVKGTKYRKNIWAYMVGVELDKKTNKHPAPFPEKLAEDHILSWSNEGDTVLDPMAGSGTTLKMAKKNNRNYIGIEISQEYIDIINKRLAPPEITLTSNPKKP